MVQERDFNELPPEPPLPFRRASPGILEVQEKSGCVTAMVGVPFLVTGSFSTLIFIGVLPHDTTLHRGWAIWVLPMTSFGFLGLGIVLLFGRKWLTLDLADGSVTRQEGLLFPMRRRAPAPR